MITISFPDFTNPFVAALWVFTHGGFVAVILALGMGAWWIYMDTIQTRFLMKLKYILLAIDVPKENEQTPKAVEHIFSHLHGIQKSPSKKDKYIDGFLQPTVTVELISIGGYIQYLIRCPSEHRDLIEAAIYAQYPNAEISEVEDYTKDVVPVFPNDSYDCWACELQNTKPEYFPIRTYPLWEHSLTQTFLDPMASLLEMMARLQEGEQIWLQFILKPIQDDKWRKAGLAAIDKMVGIKAPVKASLAEYIAGAPSGLVTGGYKTLMSSVLPPGETTPERVKDAPPSLMQHIPPPIKADVENITMKVSKTGFMTKARFVYIGQKGVFTKARISGMFGALKQFSGMDTNGFKPDSVMKTARVYWFPKWRENRLKRNIVEAYQSRSSWRGRTIFMLNTEELASLWHFPVITVKAPQVKKTEAKRGEPPTLLPIGTLDDRANIGNDGTPDNLPFGS